MGRAFLLLLVALPALAQPVSFWDDVESGTVVVGENPPGKWDSRRNLRPGVTIEASRQAAHRGSFGLRLVDPEVLAGGGVTGSVDHLFAHDAGTVALRAWIRVSSSNDAGGFHPILVHGNTPNSTVVEAIVSYPGALLRVQVFDRPGNSHSTGRTTPLTEEQWHLIEVWAEGLDSDAGRAGVLVDGADAGVTDGIDWAGIQVQRLLLGASWGDRLFTGTIDFDDIRIGDSLGAASLSLEARRRANACRSQLLSPTRARPEPSLPIPSLRRSPPKASTSPSIRRRAARHPSPK
jgi:hypothetical protein